jgi:DNA invertase Pin-like site-specific DNA recombinase
MKTAVYVRVSTDKQEAENQLIQLHDYCQKSGHEVYSDYVDITSGSKDSRPDYDRLFSDAHKKLYGLVLFWDLSRFSRSGTLFTLQKLRELENLGIEWESYTEPYLKTTGQFKDVVISIISTLARIQRQQISDRTKAGLQRLRLEGKVLGRPIGSQDKRQRKKGGYFRRWEK